MAASASFKQQCPSCEAMVPIRDRKLIGKKTDCPNCKYRFVVEEPPETEEEDGASPAAKPASKRKGAALEDKPKFKAKKPGKGGSSVMIIGGGLTLVAIGLLGVGAYYIFFKPEPVKPLTGRPLVVDPKPGNGNGNPPVVPGGLPVLGFDLTNLLPADSDQVLDIRLKNLLDSPVGTAAFGTPGAFNRKVRDDLVGFAIGDVERLLVAGNSAQDWHFIIIRTGNPLPAENIKKQMGLQPARPSSIKNRDYFEGTIGPWLDRFVTLFAPDLPIAVAQRKKQTPVGACFYDNKTLILADLVPLKKFLEDDAQPNLKDPPPLDLNNPGAPVRGAYRSLDNVALKRLLDQMEGKPETTLFRLVADTGKIKVPNAEEVVALGMSLQRGTNPGNPLTLFVGAECTTTDQAQGLTAKAKELAAGLIPRALAAGLDLQIQGIPRPNPPLPMGVVSVRAQVVQQVSTVLVIVETMPPEAARDYLVRALQPAMITLRGLADMASGNLRAHELATELKNVAEKNKEFPRASMARMIPGTRLGRPWPPSQEVSWMAALLPQMGPEYDSIYHQIQVQQSWREPQNLHIGRALIPQFLAPDTQRDSWWVTVPSLPNYRLGATHFVGIAGVGLDAADPYFRKDPANKGNLGVFGFDGGIKLDQLQAGGANTIAVIQVPPNHPRPWIAGGGATVQGVPEKDSFKPFVVPQKKGTLALMADGSVRFIAEGIADDVFKAMCTVQGATADQVKQFAAPVPPK